MSYPIMKKQDFKCMLLSQRSQSKKTTYSMILTILHSGKGKTKNTLKGSVVERCWRVGWDKQADQEALWGE